MSSNRRYHPYERKDHRNEKSFRVMYQSWHSKPGFASVPKLIGYFSLDKNRTYLPNSSQLAYYNPPKEENIKFDLNDGIEKACAKLPSADDEKISHLLKWIQLNYSKVQAPPETKKWIRPDFVCFRGLLTLLLCTQYLPRDPWVICAAKWKGTIYLCAFKKEKEADASDADFKFRNWGFKFEKYILSDSPKEPPNPSQPVDLNEEFCCMFERQIGAHKILYGAEMDGVCSEKALKDPLPIKNLKFVELKTSRKIEHSGQERNFHKFKLLKWWAQSYLVGVEKILCGFRDDSGIVRNLENFDLSDIINKSKAYWDPKCCISFCQEFLTFVSRMVVNDCDKTIYKFERMPMEDILVTEVSPTSEYSFMESYLERSEERSN